MVYLLQNEMHYIFQIVNIFKIIFSLLLFIDYSNLIFVRYFLLSVLNMEMNLNYFLIIINFGFFINFIT